MAELSEEAVRPAGAFDNIVEQGLDLELNWAAKIGVSRKVDGQQFFQLSANGWIDSLFEE
jgi:hypothetical protein